MKCLKDLCGHICNGKCAADYGNKGDPASFRAELKLYRYGYGKQQQSYCQIGHGNDQPLSEIYLYLPVIGCPQSRRGEYDPCQHGRDQAKDILLHGVALPADEQRKKIRCSIIMFIIGNRTQCKDRKHQRHIGNDKRWVITRHQKERANDTDNQEKLLLVLQ